MEQGAGQKRARQDPPVSAEQVVAWLTERIEENGLGAMDAQASAALIARFSEEGVDAEALSNFSKDDLRDEFKLNITRNPPPARRPPRGLCNLKPGPGQADPKNGKEGLVFVRGFGIRRAGELFAGVVVLWGIE